MFVQLNQDTLGKAGGLAQMVERPLSMREVPGSIPGFSKCLLFLYAKLQLLFTRYFFRHYFDRPVLKSYFTSCPDLIKVIS